MREALTDEDGVFCTHNRTSGLLPLGVCRRVLRAQPRL